MDLMAGGYLVTPITPELRDHTKKIVAAAGSAAEAARWTQLHPETILRILRGTKVSVEPDTMESLFDVLPEQFEWAPDENVVANLEQIRRSRGRLVMATGLPFRHKDRYAAHLHSVCGWTKTEVSRVLRMSGGRVSDAVRKYT